MAAAPARKSSAAAQRGEAFNSIHRRALNELPQIVAAKAPSCAGRIFAT
jgi:hypothetical protein